MAKIIVLTFDDTGATSVDAQGFAGQGCHEATKPFEDALGVVTGRQEKPEARQTVTARQGAR